MDKTALRKILLEKRKSMDADTAFAASEAIIARIRTIPRWKEVSEVLVYWPTSGEVDVRPLIQELWDRGATVLMPRCRPSKPGELDICCAGCEDDLTPGAFSIMEPDAGRCPAVKECSPDMALIPGVGFDRNGFRVGFGGGYYDRLLARPHMADTLTIAPAYGFQLLPDLPREPWDKPVHIICTEEETWRP